MSHYENKYRNRTIYNITPFEMGDMFENMPDYCISLILDCDKEQVKKYRYKHNIKGICFCLNGYIAKELSRKEALN